MWNKPEQPPSIPPNQIGLNIPSNDGFPVPQSKNQNAPYYQKPHKVGRPQQEFMKLIEGQPVPEKHEMRKISAQELAQHCTLESAWISLNGVVYDVTIYMAYHPGGLKLLEGCGRECSNLFSKSVITQTSTTPG